MKLNSSQLEAFFTVAKGLSFTKAADKLHVTQSALSQRIANLEAELETSLFIRDRTSIRLTEAGEKVLRFCQLNDSAESDLLNHLQSQEKDYAGTLRIAGFSSVNSSIVVPSLAPLLNNHPRLSIDLLSREISELIHLLRVSQVDYIITTEQNESSDLESIDLGHEIYVLVECKKKSNPNIYLDHDEKDQTTSRYFLKNKMKFNFSHRRYLGDIHGLIQGVRYGYGRAVLPLHLVEEFKDLEIIDPQKTLRVPVYLQFFKQAFYKKIHQEIIDRLLSGFQKRLS